MTKKRTGSTLMPVIGWREWISLPGLDVAQVKVKVDTGARSSSLHAFGLEVHYRDGQAWVRFEVHPWQRSACDPVVAEAPVLDFRDVKSSTGVIQRRPVIQTCASLGGTVIPIELTLTRRDEMGFRMLLGREAVRGRFLVDPGRSFLYGQASRDIRRANGRRH